MIDGAIRRRKDRETRLIFNAGVEGKKEGFGMV